MPPHDTLAEPATGRPARDPVPEPVPGTAPEIASEAAARIAPGARVPLPRRGISRTDRFEVCTGCAALVRGEIPTGDPVDLREIERGLARLTAPIGRRATLRDVGEAAGHRNAPCACCRRPLPGARVVIERTLRGGFDPDGPD